MSIYDQQEQAIARFEIDPDRHQAFRYVDQITRHELTVSQLQEHPDDPTMCLGILTVRDAGMVVGEPLEVQTPRTIVMATQLVELRPSHKKEIIAGASAITAVVAIGSLFLRHHRKR